MLSSSAVVTGTVSPSPVVPRGNWLQNLMDEGRLFKACNPTPGTGIASSVVAAFAATNALVNIRNQETVDGGVTPLLYPLYVRLIPTVVPASATRSEACVTTDTGSARYSSGAVTAPSVVNANQNSSASLAANTVRFGALTLNAATAQRIQSRFQLRGAIMVAFEEYVITFGEEGAHAFNTLGGTAVQRHTVEAGACAIGPGSDWNLHVWHPSNAATPASYEVEIALIKA